MTNTQNSGNDPESGRSHRHLRNILGRTGIVIGIVSLLGIVGGGWFAWIFVHQRLAPIVQDSLTKTLKRPVQLGRVEGFWLNGLRFGPSGIPATATDPDKASVSAVDVGFNPLQFLLTRTLKLDVTLVKPELYLEQDKQGRWVTVSLNAQQEAGGIKTELETIRLQNADAVLVPFPKPGNQLLPIKFAQIEGSGQLSEQNQRIRYQLAGAAVSGGSFKIEGDSRLTNSQTTNLLVQGQNLVGADISRLIKLPNLDLVAGFLDADLAVQLVGAQPKSYSGSAGLKEITVQIPQLPKPLMRTNGTLVFKGTQIQLDNVTSLYGQVPAIAVGTFDSAPTGGFNVKVATAPISLNKVLETFDVKQLPVAVIGEVRANLQLTGTPLQPVVTGSVVNTKLTRIDKLNIKALNANFGLVGSQLAIKSFQAQPSVGGQVDGSGEVKLGAKGGLNVGFQAQNLPGDAIARIYGLTNLPIRVGRVGAKGTVEGTLGNIGAVARWSAPDGTYPATGEVAIAPNGMTSVRDTNIQVAGGAVTGTAQLYPKNGTLQASFQASRVQGKGLEPLLKRQLPPQLQGPLSGTLNIAANVKSLQPETLSATGSAAVNIAGGTVRASNFNLNAGRFTTAVTLAGFQLGQLVNEKNQSTGVPLVAPAPVSGTFNVAGNLVKNQPSVVGEPTSKSSLSIQAKASGQLNVAGGTVSVPNLNVDADRFSASLQANGVNVGSLSPQVPPPLQGRLNGNFDLAGNLDNLQLATIQGRGSGNLNVDGGTITAANVKLNSGSFSASVQTNNLQVANLTPQLPPQLRGRLNATLDVAGSLPAGKGSPSLLATLQGRGSGHLNIGGGNVTAANVNLQAGRFSTSVQANGINVGSLAPQLPPGLQQGRLNGNFDLEGSLENPQLATIQGRGSGSLNIGGGTVTASNVELDTGRFSASVEARRVGVSTFASQIPANLRPALKGSRLNGNFDVAGSLNNLQLAAIEVPRGSGSLDNVAGGTLNAADINLNAGRFSAGVEAKGVEVSAFASQIPANLRPALKGSRLNGNFDVAGSLNNLQLAAIEVPRGSGSLDNVAGGTLNAADINLNAGRFSAAVEAKEVEVSAFASQIPANVRPALKGSRLNGNFDVAGSLNNLQLAAIEAKGSGNLNNVAGGTITASSLNLDAGRFSASVAASGVGLSPFSSQLRGNVTGNLNLSGTLASLTPSDIRAAGNLNFSQGISSVDKSLTTAFSWDGKNLQIQRVSAPGLEASGVVAFARVNRPVIPPITNFNLNVSAQDLNLEKLPIALPNDVKVAGLLDFTGNLSGTLSAPIVTGNNLRLRNLVVDGYAFDPELTGNVQLQAGKGGNLQLRGIQDRIELALSPNDQPTSFLVNLGLRELKNPQPTADRIVASGKTQGEQLLVNVQSLPLGPVKKLVPRNLLAQLPPAIAGQPVGGNLSGNFAVALGKGGLTALPSRIEANNVAIANPLVGNIQGIGNQVTVGSLSYENGNINVSDAIFQQGNTKYALSASLNQNPQGPGNFQAQVKVDQGKVQDLLTLASVFGIKDVQDIQDLTSELSQVPTSRSSTDLQSQAVGNPKDSLLVQLRRFAEIAAYNERLREAREASPIPELSQLKGNFGGEVKIAGSLKQGFTPNSDSLNVNFDLKGTDWNWAQRYTADRIIARGSLQNGVLTLLPLRLRSQNSLVAFTGSIGGEQQTGQLRVENLPVDQLPQIFNLPINVTGSLNASATLAGSIKNPLARGEATLSNGIINGGQVQSAQASFSYADARLNFGSTVVVATEPGSTASASVPTPRAGEQASGRAGGAVNSPSPVTTQQSQITQPINIVGSIPYKLPFADRAPDSNTIALTLDVQDQGLALLNVLSSGQADWVDGAGQVQLQVNGSIDPKTNKIQELVANGTATVNNATIKAQALPNPLTGITGKVLFNLNQITVEGLEPTEKFQAKYGNGVITASGALPISTPLTTDTNLKVHIGELAVNIKGLYNGGVKGDVQVTNTALAPKLGGEVQLFNGNVQVQSEVATAVATNGGSGGNGLASNKIEFNNLKLSLGKSVQVTLSPIFNFLAQGDLTVNGSLDQSSNIHPSGTINLKRGQVNLFTTQFRLDRGYPQTATFVPDQGLVPNLNVRLVANVAEVRGSKLPINTASGELNNDTSASGEGTALSTLFVPTGEVREDIPATDLDTLGTVRIQAIVKGPTNQLSQALQLTSNPPRSEAEIVALLGGGFVQTLGQGGTTLGLANLAGSALLGGVQNVIGDALGLSEFRIFPTANINDKNRSSSALDLAAEIGVDINRRLSATALKSLTSDQSPQFGLRYQLNNQILLRGSTDLSGDNRAVVEYEKRF